MKEGGQGRDGRKERGEKRGVPSLLGIRWVILEVKEGRREVKGRGKVGSSWGQGRRASSPL